MFGRVSPKLAICRQDMHNRDMHGKDYPAKRDYRAADYIRELRESRGLSPTQLADAIAEIATKGKDECPYTVSSRTIYRIEEEGQVPTVRIKFALAAFFGVPMADIWQTARRRVAA